MIGDRLSHYVILREIGSGGMGTVYLARDQNLQCDVALKVLAEGTIEDAAARARFRREAQMLAKRNHPNIVTVLNFDTHEGMDFLVMELVTGTTLKERIRHGPLAEPDAVRLGCQLLRGLSAAHEAGVVHGDLKPGNLKITHDGTLKILDFGLARLDPSAAGLESTGSTGTVQIAGTLPYMAPEQLLGTRANPSSDLFAVGVVLYEMLVGALPWARDLPTAVADEILHSNPPRPSERRAGVSPAVDGPIMRALSKDPAKRHGSAREFLDEWSVLGAMSGSPGGRLRRWAAIGALTALIPILLLLMPGVWERLRALWGGGAERAVDSIAVLPLVNLSNDREQEYFADGMTEELITTLSQIGSLSVRSRTTMMQFKGKEPSMSEIARRLHVHHVVEGSVARAGGRVRISAKLVDASHDRPLWANTYDRDVADVLGLQAEVAQAIANEVRVKLTPREQARLRQVRPVVPAAHEAYLRGLYLWNGREPRDLTLAIESYKQAAALDPGYALPHAGLADAYDFLGNLSQIPQSTAYGLARQEATQALAIDSTLAEAHASLAELRTEYEWDWAGAEREFRRAIELNPGYATAHEWYAEYLSRMGRHEEALAEIRRAVELDPLSPPVNGMLGTVYFHGRQTDRAIQLYRRALAMRPDVLDRKSVV